MRSLTTRLRVVQVIDGLGDGGGTETSVASLVPLLHDRGIDVSVICLFDRGGWGPLLQAQGFSVEILPRSGRAMRIKRLRSMIAGHHPDLIVATLVESTLNTRLACIGLPTRRIDSLVSTTYDPVRTRDGGIPPWKLNTLRATDRFTSKWVDAFHVVSQSVAREAILELRVPPHKLHLIPRGRSRTTLGQPGPQRRALVRQRLGIAETIPVILNVGRQVRAKNQVELVHAFERIEDLPVHPLLVIAGQDGDATQELHMAVASSSAKERIHLIGQRGDVPDLLCAADVFAFPSLYEGMPGTLIEAMAMGCPIVGSDAPSVLEVLDHGRLGRIAPRHSPSALAQEILHVLKSPQDRERMRRAGLHEFENAYLLESVADATATLFRQIAGVIS